MRIPVLCEMLDGGIWDGLWKQQQQRIGEYQFKLTDQKYNMEFVAVEDALYNRRKMWYGLRRPSVPLVTEWEFCVRGLELIKYWQFFPS
jgi:hypothetical protein